MERTGEKRPPETGGGAEAGLSRSQERGRAARKRAEEVRDYILSAEQRQATLDAVSGAEERYGRPLTDSERRAIQRAEPEFYGVVKRHDKQGYQANAAGKVFEKGATALLIDGFGYREKKNGMFVERERDMSTRVTNIAEDVLEGADVIVNRLPVDITLNPEKGGEIGRVDENGELKQGYSELGEVEGVRISAGFRITNGARRLPMPVCVMLFEGAGRRLDASEMLERMRRNPQGFRQLADDAMASYWDYADAAEEAA
ncbi:hypothetical protein FWG76_01875 [Candidatus Saccharibacteria bacterium]|nr:hypothetical protein [Candidatus Saccharibacteria bacterium]